MKLLPAVLIQQFMKLPEVPLFGSEIHELLEMPAALAQRSMKLPEVPAFLVQKPMKILEIPAIPVLFG